MAIGGSDILGGCRGVGDVASVGGFASRGEVGVNWRGVEFRGLGNGTEITVAQGNGLQHMPERGRSFLSFISCSTKWHMQGNLARANPHGQKEWSLDPISRGWHSCTAVTSVRPDGGFWGGGS